MLLAATRLNASAVALFTIPPPSYQICKHMTASLAVTISNKRHERAREDKYKKHKCHTDAQTMIMMKMIIIMLLASKKLFMCGQTAT